MDGTIFSSPIGEQVEVSPEAIGEGAISQFIREDETGSILREDGSYILREG